MLFESCPSQKLRYAVSAKDKKITALLIFLPENLENFRSTEFYGAALDGSTIFSKSQFHMLYVNGKLSIS